MRGEGEQAEKCQEIMAKKSLNLVKIKMYVFKNLKKINK